jgi:integrating conjugative element protein (TIGR03761 family)
VLTTGKFNHESTLEIHTKQAKQLINENKQSQMTEGKKAYMIIGLDKFGGLLQNIWSQIRRDDPYAEMVLIEIERRAINTFDLLEKLNHTIDSQLQLELPGITMAFYQSENPAVIPLNKRLFETTHALLGARLVGLYDLLIRKLHTCQQFGMINRNQSNHYKYKATKALRGVFAAPLLYKPLGVTRMDIIQKTDKGLSAIDQRGEIPLDILTREKQSKFGPTSRNTIQEIH